MNTKAKAVADKMAKKTEHRKNVEKMASEGFRILWGRRPDYFAVQALADRYEQAIARAGLQLVAKPKRKKRVTK